MFMIKEHTACQKQDAWRHYVSVEIVLLITKK